MIGGINALLGAFNKARESGRNPAGNRMEAYDGLTNMPSEAPAPEYQGPPSPVPEQVSAVGGARQVAPGLQEVANQPIAQAPGDHYGKRAGFDLGDVFGSNSILSRALRKPKAAVSHAGDMARATVADVRRDISPTHQDARSFAQNFDPSDAGSVSQMQEHLNASGYTDQDGNPLKVDGKMGDRTEFALRRLQRTDNLHQGYGGPGGDTPVTPVGESTGPQTAAPESNYDESLTEADFPAQWGEDTSGPVDDSQWNWGSWKDRDEYSQGTARQAKADYEAAKRGQKGGWRLFK